MQETLQRILAAYELAESNLLAIVTSYTLDGSLEEPDNEAWATQKLASIKQLRAEIVKVLLDLKQLDSVAGEALVKQYLLGGNSYVEGFIGTNAQALNALVADYTGILTSTRYQILRSTEDVYRRVIAESAMSGVAGIDTRLTTARMALARFANEGITGFISKDGRNYDMRSYVEMASRTTLNNALREGRASGLEQSGKDLIIISAHPNPSPDCAPYERKILSLSGKDTRYTSLQEAKNNGLFHPSCKHSFTAYLPGITKVEAPKESDDYEATQDLRYSERQTRKWKRRLSVATTPQEEQKAKAKIKQWRANTKQIAEDNNLVYKSNRISNVQAR